MKKTTKPAANTKTSRITQTTTRLSNPVSRKKLAMIVIGIIVVLFGMKVMSNKAVISMNPEEKKMATYLQEKYGKEFVVKNYRVEGAGLGVEGDPTAEGYPKDDTSLEFVVIDRGKFKEGKHAYSDDYPGAVWSREESENIKPKLKEIFGYVPEYKLRISTVSKLDGKITGDFGHFSDTNDSLRSQMAISFIVDVNESSEKKNLEYNTEKGWQLVSYLKSLNMWSYFFRYNTTDKRNYISLEGSSFTTINDKEDVMKSIKRGN